METTELTENDLAGLAELYKEFWNEDSSLEKMRPLFHKVGNDPNYIFLVVKDDGILAGSVMGVICENLYGECKPFMVVEDVVVSKDLRPRGIGTILMRELEKIAVERNCRQTIFVTESNRTDAIAFYQSLGYEADRYTGFKKKLADG
jgi:ribosomal protein S18 acetylase RimI-like enzyme